MDKDTTNGLVHLILHLTLYHPSFLLSMELDFGIASASPGSKITVEIIEINENNVVCTDENGAKYRHYFNTCPLWPDKKEYAVLGAKLWGAVGDSTTEKGYLRFFVRKFISLPQSEQTEVPFDATDDVPRSPYDVITAKGMDPTPMDTQLDETLASIQRHRPEPIAGDTASINIRIEGELAAYVRRERSARKCTARAVVERAIAGAMAYDS